MLAWRSVAAGAQGLDATEAGYEFWVIGCEFWVRAGLGAE